MSKETEFVNATKSAVGISLAGAAGELCMRTRCQDIIPRQLSSACRTEGRGRHARQVCRPFLAACQNDKQAQDSCAESCAKYYNEDMANNCKDECMRSHCRIVPEYETCVMLQKIRDVLECMENGEGRQIAMNCLEQRCGLKCKPDQLTLPKE